MSTLKTAAYEKDVVCRLSMMSVWLGVSLKYLVSNVVWEARLSRDRFDKMKFSEVEMKLHAPIPTTIQLLPRNCH